MLAQLILVGTLTVTAYQATPGQTKPECKDNWNCATSDGDSVLPIGCAVSQDLLATHRVNYHEWLVVDGRYCYVNDTMNARLKNAIDLLAWTPQDEKAVKPHKTLVYRLARQPKQKELYGKRRYYFGEFGISVSDVSTVNP